VTVVSLNEKNMTYVEQGYFSFAFFNDGFFMRIVMNVDFPLIFVAMGKFPKRELHCKICKSSFFSYKQFSKDSLSHRSHRNRAKSKLSGRTEKAEKTASSWKLEMLII
jgi:hypothetical protein